VKKKELKMKSPLKVGIIGEYDSKKKSHPATMEAIGHAADFLSVETKVDWLPTPSFLDEEGLGKLADYDVLWASSGSPYQTASGMLNAIRWARESGKPFIAT
jgi:CTP synthase (UTP-ammonia lyase)